MNCITKDELLHSFLRECDICVHLYHKIPAGSLSYRPTPGQRTLLELLQYMSYMTAGFVKMVVDGDRELYKAGEDAGATLNAQDFPAAMEEQKALIRQIFSTLSDERLSEGRVQMPWGEELSVGAGLLEFPYRCIVGYRMQLFLYVKAAGNSEISTANCWAGVDLDPQ